MANSTIISLAIIKTNYNHGLDVYGNFVPILAECIRQMDKEYISVPEIKVELINRFCINIPQHVINTILLRLRNNGLISLNVKEGTLTPERKLLQKTDFFQVRQDALRKHELVLQDLVNYCRDKFSKEWTIEEAEIALLSFLEEFQLPILQRSTEGKLIPFDTSTTTSGKFLIGGYVKHLIETSSSNLDYLDAITKGYMLANAMYLPNPSLAKRKFRQTEIFFDTTVLIHALGYAGEARKAPCTELLEMLYETGAELRCFNHTKDEVIGVLENTATLIAQNRIQEVSRVAQPTIEYFISINATPADIKSYIVKLEENLFKKLRIKVVLTPNYSNYNNVIDEEDFRKLLAEHIHYRNADGNASRRDVLSISAIFRLRQGFTFKYIEDAKAIFITSNPKLTRVTENYFLRMYGLDGVPLSLTDHNLTNLLWLKAPLKLPNLPMKAIIADCYAALQPSSELWRDYLHECDNLAVQEEITEDDYFMLRYEFEAKNVLMEKTLGEEGAFTQGTVHEIKEIIKQRYQAGISTELQVARQQVTEQNRREMIRKDQIKNKAMKLAQLICWSLRGFLFIVLIVCNILSFVYALPNNKDIFYVFALFFITLIYSAIDYRRNIFFELNLRKLEVTMVNFFEDRFMRFAGYNELAKI